MPIRWHLKESILSLFPLLVRLRVIFDSVLNESEIAILPDLVHDFLSHGLSEVSINPEEQLYCRVLESLEGYLLLHDLAVVSLFVDGAELHDVTGENTVIVHDEAPFQLCLILFFLVLADLGDGRV